MVFLLPKRTEARRTFRMALLARSSLFQTLHGDLGFFRTILGFLLRRVGFELRRLLVFLIGFLLRRVGFVEIGGGTAGGATRPHLLSKIDTWNTQGASWTSICTTLDTTAATTCNRNQDTQRPNLLGTWQMS